MTKKFGMLAASAAAIAFSGPIAVAGPKLVDGHYCQNNKCKGNSACGGYGNTNGCKGHNTCAGKGWLKKETKEACEKGGLGKWTKATVTPMKKK